MRIPCEKRCPRPRGACGFSLTELVIVAMIIALMAGIALPRFSNALARQRADAAARRVVVDLTLAQRQARTSSTSQSVEFHEPTPGYTLMEMPHPDQSGLEYKVSLTEEPYGVTALSAGFSGGHAVVFDMHGVPDSGGSIVIQVGNQIRTISVDPDTGEASVQ